jgi:hypothetical protein
LARSACSLLGSGTAGFAASAAAQNPAPTATAVLIQPNLDVGAKPLLAGPGEWDSTFAEFKRLAGEQCKTYIAGIPQTGAPNGESSARPTPRIPI